MVNPPQHPNCIRKDYFSNQYDIRIGVQNTGGFLVGIESPCDPNSRLEDSLN